MVMLERWDRTPGDPIEEVGVGAFEQSLVAVELAVVKVGKTRIGKAPEDQIALPRAAMPRTERKPLAANVRW